MSEKKVEKAISESSANVEVEGSYPGKEELKKIKESILKEEPPIKVLKKLVELHSEKRKEEQRDKRT